MRRGETSDGSMRTYGKRRERVHSKPERKLTKLVMMIIRYVAVFKIKLTMSGTKK